MPKRIGSKNKYQQLLSIINRLAPVIVAYSGGMDSSFLLWACSQTLPPDKFTAVTFNSPTLPSGQLDTAKKIARYLNAQHTIIDAPDMENINFLANDLLRCYYCKRERFAFLQKNKYQFKDGPVNIIEGSQMDDLNEYRPGMRAVKELGIISPLIQAGLNRGEIEAIALKNNLPFYHMLPESCLATRIKTGQTIEPQLLEMIDKAEILIKSMGFSMIRVRLDDGTARLEFVPEEIEKAFLMRKQIIDKLKKQGFNNITLDLEGYKRFNRGRISE